MVMYISYTSQQQNILDGDVCIIHITPTEHLDGDIYIIHITPKNTLDGDVYIIHITLTEHLRW